MRSQADRAALLACLAGYAVITGWRAARSPFPTHGDGCWYDMVARNWASGRGLTEDCLWHFALLRDHVVGPIGNYWNPLAAILTGIAYHLFGISTAVARMPAILMDGVVTAGIFLFALQRLHSRTLAVFAAIFYTLHPYALTHRSGGGHPETYLQFFVALFTWQLIRAWEGRRLAYVWAAGCGALAYLSRNEGGMSLIALAITFAYREFIQDRRAGFARRSQTLLYGLGILAVFVGVAAPWEIRNHLLYGPMANEAKYRFFWARDYWDVWSYSRSSTFMDYLAQGPTLILKQKLMSYVYKMELWASVTTWPVLLFLFPGWMATRRKSWRWPVLIYALVSLGLMGFLNSVSQQGGWNGIAVYLPFFIPLSLAGLAWTAEQGVPSIPIRRITVIASASLIALYLAADNLRMLHRLRQRNTSSANIMMAVDRWFQDQGLGNTAVPMIHFALEYTYFTGRPSVRIPTYDPPEKVYELAERYGCTHVVMVGTQSRSLVDVFNGTPDPRFKKVADIPYIVTLENGGTAIRIFEIQPGLSPVVRS